MVPYGSVHSFSQFQYLGADPPLPSLANTSGSSNDAGFLPFGGDVEDINEFCSPNAYSGFQAEALPPGDNAQWNPPVGPGWTSTTSHLSLIGEVGYPGTILSFDTSLTTDDAFEYSDEPLAPFPDLPSMFVRVNPIDSTASGSHNSNLNLSTASGLNSRRSYETYFGDPLTIQPSIAPP